MHYSYAIYLWLSPLLWSVRGGRHRGELVAAPRTNPERDTSADEWDHECAAREEAEHVGANEGDDSAQHCQQSLPAQYARDGPEDIGSIDANQHSTEEGAGAI